MRKRDFIKLVAGSLGGAVLSSCSDGGGGTSGGGALPVPPLPNGHRFFRVKAAGQDVASRAIIDKLPGSAYVSDSGHIAFHARAQDGGMGLYQVSVDYTAGQPTITDEVCVIREGDILPDGRAATALGAVDANHLGAIAVAVSGETGEPEDHESAHHGLYTIEAGGTARNILRYGHELSDGAAQFMGTLGDVDLHDDGNVLVVANLGAGSLGMPCQCLVHVPGGAFDAATIVTHTGDLVPDADGVVRGIGLVDMHDGGEFVAQAFVDRVGDVSPEAAGGSLRPASTALIAGNVRSYGGNRLLAASRSLGARADEGDSTYGPRIGSDGIVANILHVSDTTLALVYHGQTVLTTGDDAPGGGEVLGFGPGVIGSDGVLYYTLLSRSAAGMELVAYNGRDHKILLSRGDTLSDGGPTVETIVFGATTEQVDSSGVMAFVAEFADGSSSVVAGIPV